MAVKTATDKKTNVAASKTVSKSNYVEGAEIDGDFMIITLKMPKQPKPCMKDGKPTGNSNLATTGGFRWDMLDHEDYSSVGVSVNVIGKP